MGSGVDGYAIDYGIREEGFRRRFFRETILPEIHMTHEMAKLAIVLDTILATTSAISKSKKNLSK